MPSNSAGTKRPSASSIPEERVPSVGDRAARAPTVDTVAVAVSLPVETVPTEQVAAGLTAGAMLHVKVTPAGSNPFDGVMVMLDVADWPGVTEDGEKTEAARVKSAVTLMALEVLALKLPSPT